MIGGVTRRMLPHLSGVPHLHVNRPLEGQKNSSSLVYALSWSSRAVTAKKYKNCDARAKLLIRYLNLVRSSRTTFPEYVGDHGGP